jgi:hypothetical protein
MPPIWSISIGASCGKTRRVVGRASLPSRCASGLSRRDALPWEGQSASAVMPWWNQVGLLPPTITSVGTVTSLQPPLGSGCPAWYRETSTKISGGHCPRHSKSIALPSLEQTVSADVVRGTARFRMCLILACPRSLIAVSFRSGAAVGPGTSQVSFTPSGLSVIVRLARSCRQ